MKPVAATMVAALALAACAAAPALAAEPKTSVSDLEDEVMCPVCGTSLGLAEDAPQAERERAFIQRLVDEGRSKDEIKDALVAEFGPGVLALPEDEGFELAAYIVPALVLLAALAAIGFAATRWRHARPRAAASPGERAVDPRDSKRLDDDLERYDL